MPSLGRLNRPMEIFFSDIPEEGLPVSGSLLPEFFGLKPDDSIRLTGPIDYNLTLYSFEEVVVLTGQVSGDFELQCVTCLEHFAYQADFPAWNSEFDIEEGQVKFDPRESLRDEVLLVLPTVPHCDELLEDRICPKVELLEKFERDDSEPIEEPAPDDDDDVWGALDGLKTK